MTQNHFTAVRLDATTDAMLKGLVIDLNFNKSQVMRRSIRLLNELTEIRKVHGEIKLITAKGKELLILLG